MNRFMTHFAKIMIIIKGIVLVLAITDALLYTNYKWKIYLLLYSILILYEIVNRFNQRQNKSQNFILILALIICTIIMHMEKTGSPILIYYFCLLDDIFEIYNKKTRKIYVFLHFALYIIIRLCEEGIEKKEAFYNILTSIGFYLGIILIFEIIHHYKEERDRFKLLYNNIVQYSFQEREYMISQNRSKISQELHDSLGHLLMGAMLNIKYLKENNKNKDDTKELSQLENIIGDCIKSVRKCVNDVKEAEEIINLNEEVSRISTELRRVSVIDIKYSAYSGIENLPNHIKNEIFKIIKEAITNSITHGDATSIQISIYKLKIEKKIIIAIIDNGKGCKEIKESYGLQGIRKRVQEFNGIVNYRSQGRGFIIKIEFMEEFVNDKNYGS